MNKPRSTGDDPVSRVRIHDVAQMAGVSIATVSRVLNDHPDVSSATREEVLRHVRELGYSNNRRADSVPLRRSKLVALQVPNLRSTYVKEILAGVVEALEDRDARPVICATNGHDAPDRGLAERLLLGVTDGALLVLSGEESVDLTVLLESGYPIVSIEPLTGADDRVPAVATTNWAGAKVATEYLIGLGHTHIGVITGPAQGRASTDRVAGYQAALLAAGLPLLPRLIQEGDWSIESGYQAALRLLTLPGQPTAIFAMNDAMAVGVLRAAREQGLGVPRHLSVVGFDDVELASISVPALTTVRQPLQGLGRVGVDVLYRLLHGRQLDASRIELSTSLVVRDSTAPPHGTSFLT